MQIIVPASRRSHAVRILATAVLALIAGMAAGAPPEPPDGRTPPPMLALIMPDEPGTPTLDVEWARFRNYVTAHAWIADIDFREGEVQGMHVCVGFNAFREPEQLPELGFAEGKEPVQALAAAAFTIAMNTPGFIQSASGHVGEIVKSEEYAASAGDDRLRLVRSRLWHEVASDTEIDSSILETVDELRELTHSLVAAGLLEAQGSVEQPFVFMTGINTLMGEREHCAAILSDPQFEQLADRPTRQAFFMRRFLDLVIADSGIDDEQMRKKYRANLGKTLGKMFDAGGSYVVRIVGAPE